MYRAYIAELTEGRLVSFFHTPENGICRKVYENGRWGRALSLALDAGEHFTVSMNGAGFFIVYADKKGGMMLCEGNERGSVTGPLMGAGEGEPGCCHMLTGQGGTRLVYSAGEGDAARLESRMLSKSVEPEPPYFIDDISPGAEGSFRFQRVTDEHSLIFYQTRKPESHLGYREINLERVGAFNPVHVLPSPAAGYSFLTTEEAVHFLYITRGVLSNRLIYRKRHQAGLTAAVTVWEAPRMEDCLLFIIENKILACYVSAGGLYISESRNDGQSFSRPARYRNKLCESPVKAAFLPKGPLKEGGCALREVLVDGASPWDVQLIPDMYEDFYPLPNREARREPPVPPEAQTQPEPQAIPEQYKHPEPNPNPFPGMEAFYGADLPEDEKLRNRIELLERKLAAKEREVMGLNTLKQEVETQRNLIKRLYGEREEAEKRQTPENPPGSTAPQTNENEK